MASSRVDLLLREGDKWLVDSLVVPATLHDTEGRFVYMNAAAERASGKSNAEMRGRALTALLPPEVRPSVDAQFRRVIELGEPTDFETVFADESGELKGARVQQLPLRDGDVIVGALTLAFDVRQVPVDGIGRVLEPRLTSRQRQILGMVSSGLSTAEIAKELTLSTETIRNHLRSVFRELNAHTRVEAIATAQRIGLLAAPGLGSTDPDKGAGST